MKSGLMGCAVERQQFVTSYFPNYGLDVDGLSIKILSGWQAVVILDYRNARANKQCMLFLYKLKAGLNA